MIDINAEIDLNNLAMRTCNVIRAYNEYVLSNPPPAGRNYRHLPIKTIKDLALTNQRELHWMPNCGRKTLRELENFLQERGLRFNMTEGDFSKIELSKIRVVSQNVEISLGADVFEGVKQAFKYAYDNQIDVIIERANGFKITIEKII